MQHLRKNSGKRGRKESSAKRMEWGLKIDERAVRHCKENGYEKGELNACPPRKEGEVCRHSILSFRQMYVRNFLKSWLNHSLFSSRMRQTTTNSLKILLLEVTCTNS